MESVIAGDFGKVGGLVEGLGFGLEFVNVRGLSMVKR